MAAKVELQALVMTFIDEHLPTLTEYVASQSRHVNAGTKTLTANLKENVASKLFVALCEGSIPGKLEDVMFGMMSPTLEFVRVKSSYIDDIANAAVLSSVVKPTPGDPLHSIVLKRTQIHMPLQSMKLVKIETTCTRTPRAIEG
uniref:Uncharacterized protein n=1 Tax=Peronospora matthiolae TaxID=2874970 RepID=A0AAV1USB8_9STRA